MRELFFHQACNGLGRKYVTVIVSKILILMFYVTNDKLLSTFTGLLESKTIIYLTSCSSSVDKGIQTYLSVLSQKLSIRTQVLSPFLVFVIFQFINKNYTDLFLSSQSKKKIYIPEQQIQFWANQAIYQLPHFLVNQPPIELSLQL